VDQLGPFLLTDSRPREGRLEVRVGRDDAGREVVVRVLRGPALIDDDARASFLRDVERARAANGGHPCDVVAGGEQNGDLWVATLPPAGEALLELRKRARATGGLGVSEALLVAEGAAEALHGMHEAGIEHRDVDARGVFVDEAGNVHVDRACAWWLQEHDELDEDRRDDQQQLGALLWEALIDRRLLPGAVEPPSSLREDVTPAIDSVVARALSEEPAGRFRSLRELGDELRRTREQLEAGRAPAELRSLVTGQVGATPGARQTRPEPRRVDVPIFAADERVDSNASLFAWAAGLGVVALIVFVAFAGWTIKLATKNAKVVVVDEPPPDEPWKAQKDAPAPTGATLKGPDGHTEVLPPSTPTVLQVWLQGCRDCMPKFENARRAWSSGELAGVPIVNVAYGRVDLAWAKKWGVNQRLVVDKGSVLVKPLGIGTFSPIVMFPNGRWRYVPVTESGYGDALREAIARGASPEDRRWQPPRR
jgi:hypothetical protein